MKKANKKKQRIIFIISSTLISLVALLFIITNFRNNIVFFYSPNELKTAIIPDKKLIRVGGLVKEGSIRYLPDAILEFTITDLQEELIIQYKGIKPDLFRQGQGIIAKGTLDVKNNIFIANELLAKHDENYMPPEIAKSLKSLKPNHLKD